VVDALVSFAFKIFDTQAYSPVGVIEFASATARVPLRLESWEGFRDAAEIRPVTAFVGTRIGGEFDGAARNGFLHDLRQVANLIILFRASHVESLIVDLVQGRVQYGKERAGNIFDVHDRAPRSAIAFDEYAARRGPSSWPTQSDC